MIFVIILVDSIIFYFFIFTQGPRGKKGDQGYIGLPGKSVRIYDLIIMY